MAERFLGTIATWKSLIIYFSALRPESAASWALRETMFSLSGAVEQKNSIHSLAVKKKASDHILLNLGFASADNYM